MIKLLNVLACVALALDVIYTTHLIVMAVKIAAEERRFREAVRNLKWEENDD